MTTTPLTKYFAFAACALVSVTCASFAGPERMSSKEVMPAPEPCDWSGFYIGGNVGYAGYELRATDIDSIRVDAGEPLTAVVNDQNIVLGGQVGHNWQFNAAVFGLEADADWANIEASQRTPFGDNVFFEHRGEIEFFGTVRGRVGLAYQNVLVYVTGGGAFAEGDRVSRLFQVGDGDEHWRADDWRWGLCGGGGVEVKVNCHWSVRAEVLYVDFQDDTAHFGATGSSNALGGFTDGKQSIQETRFGFDDDMWMVRFGVNYHFGQIFGH